MNYKGEYRDVNGHLLGSSLPSVFGGQDYFNPNGQRLGFTDESNTYNNDAQKIARDDIGAALLVRRSSED